MAERFAHLAHTEGMLVCWACAIPVVLQIHARLDAQAHPAAEPSPDVGEGHPPRPHARPVRACTRTAPRPDSPPRDTATCIRDCAESIIANRPLACGLVCHLAPYVQLERVPYGHGDLVGTAFEYRTGSKAQVYLVAPAGRFVRRDHGPLTVYDETQLRAYYRSIPDMQNPTQVFGRIPLDCRLRPPPASPSPPCGTPPSTMGMTPGRTAPPVVSHPEDISLIRQYYRISLVVSSRRAANPTRGGGHTARCILSRGRGGFPHDNAVCRDVYKHIARVAHPDKNPVRSAYHCAVAGIVMDTIQRAYDMVGSSSSSDRDAFHLLPALDSEQFEGMVDAHRLAKTGHTPSVRSPITPVARSSATPIPADNRPLAGPHIPPLPLPGFADPLSPESRPFSATDALPGDSPARSRPQQAGDSSFSDIEDDDNDDGSAFLFDATHAPAAVPATSRPYVNVVCDAPRDLVRIGRYHCTHRPYVGIDVLVAQISERRAELAFLRSTWPRGSAQPIGAASDMAVATTAALTDPSSPDMTMTDTDGAMGAAPAPSPGEPIAPVSARALSVPSTSVSDAPPLTTVGTSHQGVAPILAPSEPIASVSDGRPARVRSVQVTSTTDGRPLSSASASPRGPGPPPTAGPHRDTGTGGSSAPHFPTVPSLAADDATIPVASAVTILAASPSLDATVDTVAGATATATSTAGVGMEVDTDPVPITTVPPTAGRISSFLSYIRRSVADDATATAASAAETLATPPSPDVNVDANEGATASAAFAAAVSVGSSDVSVFRHPH